MASALRGKIHEIKIDAGQLVLELDFAVGDNDSISHPLALRQVPGTCLSPECFEDISNFLEGPSGSEVSSCSNILHRVSCAKMTIFHVTAGVVEQAGSTQLVPSGILRTLSFNFMMEVFRVEF